MIVRMMIWTPSLFVWTLFTTNIAARADNLSKLFTFPLVSHADVIERHRRSLLEGFTGIDFQQQINTLQQVDALYQGYGTHYIDLWVGTPPQRQTVIVATGSPATGFPCAGCVDCGELYHTDTYFDPDQSSTFKGSDNYNCKFGIPLGAQCVIGVSYVEGSSWRGPESTDVTYAGGPHNLNEFESPVFNEEDRDDVDPLRAKDFAFNHTFSCQDQTGGLFRTQLADGIMGMDNTKESFWHQAYDAGVISKKAFALCLSRKTSASKSGTEAGALTMGGHDVRLHTSPMIYAKLDPAVFFQLTLKKIYLREGGGGDSALSTKPDLRISPLDVSDSTYDNYKKVIVDSGTTDTYFPIGFSNAFKDLWQEMAGIQYNHKPMLLTQEELNNLPTILLQLEGYETFNAQKHQNGEHKGENDAKKVPGLAASVDQNNPFDLLLAIPPSHYMQQTESGYYVARFYVDDFQFTATIGANSMMGHDVLFDVEEGLLGFAESHCDYTQLEEEVEKDEEKEAGIYYYEGTDDLFSDEESSKENGNNIKTNNDKEEGSPEAEAVVEIYEKEKDDVEELLITTESHGLDFDSKEDSTGKDGGNLMLTLVALVTLFVGGSYVSYDRYGGKEFLARRGHIQISEVTSEYDNELELSQFETRNGGYVNPIV